jgi:hypothetical protein
MALPLVTASGQPTAQTFPKAGTQNFRELQTDRPDFTESPVTVDRGRSQIESSFVTFSRNDDAGIRTESLGLMESNLKLGLTDVTDLQLVFTPYIRETTISGGVRSIVEDAGDVTVRLKRNLWGIAEGPTAFGLLPFLKIPTGTAVSNGEWEGGLAAPFLWRGGERWDMGAQAQVDRVYDAGDDAMDWEFSHTLVLGLGLTEKLGVYLEYVGIAGDHPYDSYFSGGVTYALGEFIQLDAGTLVGLNESADDLTLFSGISWKF